MKTRLRTLAASIALAALTVAPLACGTLAGSQSASCARDAEHYSRVTVARFVRANPSLSRRFEQAHAYVVFPRVGQGALGIGGAYGEGTVFREGRVIGAASLTALSAGAQIGGQSFSEVVFFENEAAFQDFMRGGLEFEAKASVVAADRGSSKSRAYDKGVAAFTMQRQGLMAEAAVAGQRFEFRAVEEG